MMHLERARELFEAAAALPRDQRTDFVRQHAADDPELMLTVLRLLEHDEPTTSIASDGSRHDAHLDGQDGGHLGPNEAGFDAADGTSSARPGLRREPDGHSAPADGQLGNPGAQDDGHQNRPRRARQSGDPQADAGPEAGLDAGRVATPRAGAGPRSPSASKSGSASGTVGLVQGMRLRERQADWQGGELWLVEPSGGGHKMAALLHPRPDSIRAALVRWRMVRPQVDAVEHPVIGRMIDAGRTADDRLYLLMQPHLPLTLDDWILHHRPNGGSMSAVVTQLASVLAAAHRKGVFHGRFGAPMVRLRADQDAARATGESQRSDPFGSAVSGPPQAGPLQPGPAQTGTAKSPSAKPSATRAESAGAAPTADAPAGGAAGGGAGALRIQVNGFGLEQVLGVLAGKGRPLGAAEDWVGLAAVVARLATELEERLPSDPHLADLNRWSDVARLRADFDPLAVDTHESDRAAAKPSLLTSLSTSMLPSQGPGKAASNGARTHRTSPSGYLGLIIGGAITGILAGEVAMFVARDAGLVWGSAAALTVGVLSAGLALVMGYQRPSED